MSVTEIVRNLHQQYRIQAQQQTQQNPLIVRDEQWPSPCEILPENAQGLVQWQAVEQPSEASLDALAKALETRFPDDLNALFSSFYGDHLTLNYQDHEICLLQAWNEQDFSNLQQNITGHVLMKRRLKQDDTVFFALTETEDMLIVVKLNDGSVWLEQVGKKPHQQLAASISDFLSQCEAKFVGLEA